MHSVTLGQFYFCPAGGVRWPFKYCFAFGDGSKQVWINVWICVSCRVPLEVEVWHKDTNSRDQLMGKATIQLSHLLMSERRRFQTWTGQQGWRQTHQDRIPVLKPQQYETFKFKPSSADCTSCPHIGFFLTTFQHRLSVPLKRWQSWASWPLWRIWDSLKPEKSSCLNLYRWDVHVCT